MELSLLLGLVSLVMAAVWFFGEDKRARRVRQIFAKIPGPRQFPIIGSAYAVTVPTDEVVNMLMGLYNKYGPRHQVNMMGRPTLLLHSAKDCEKVLSSNENIKRNVNYDSIRPWLGDGLLCNSGAKWRHHRKLITPAFHFKILNNFLVTFNDHFRAMADRLEHNCGLKDQVVDLYSAVNKATLDIICGTAMGIKVDSQSDDGFDNYRKAIHRFTDLVVYRTFHPWLLMSEWLWRLSSQGRESRECEKTLHDFTNKIIEERRAEFNSKAKNASNDSNNNNADDGASAKGKTALMDLLLETQAKDPKALSDEDLLDEVNTFIFAGHDTTTSHVAWTLMLLGNHPEHQSKVQEELDVIFGDDRSRDVTPADLADMKYLEQCMKESLRLYSPAAFMAREINHDFELDDGTVVPAGCEVMVSPYVIHRDETCFPEPEKFDPERFTLENSANRHPYAYLPFSAGPRNCIGQKFAQMESKAALAWVFRRFQVTTVTPMDEIKCQYASVIKPSQNLRFQLTKRC